MSVGAQSTVWCAKSRSPARRAGRSCVRSSVFPAPPSHSSSPADSGAVAAAEANREVRVSPGHAQCRHFAPRQVTPVLRGRKESLRRVSGGEHGEGRQTSREGARRKMECLDFSRHTQQSARNHPPRTASASRPPQIAQYRLSSCNAAGSRARELGSNVVPRPAKRTGRVPPTPARPAPGAS